MDLRILFENGDMVAVENHRHACSARQNRGWICFPAVSPDEAGIGIGVIVWIARLGDYGLPRQNRQKRLSK